MVIPPPLKRKQRKAIRYLEALTARVLAESQYHIHSRAKAELFAQALVIAALFDDEERELFSHIYERGKDLKGAPYAELYAMCREHGKERLCHILSQLFVTDVNGITFADYLKRIIENETWIPVQEELEENRFREKDFMWDVR
jgi:hypothetical protein